MGQARIFASLKKTKIGLNNEEKKHMQILEIILVILSGVVLTVIYKYEKLKRITFDRDIETIKYDHHENVKNWKYKTSRIIDLDPISDEETEMYDHTTTLVMWKSMLHMGKRVFNDTTDVFLHNAFVQIVRRSNNIFLIRIISDMNCNPPLSSSKWYIIQRGDGTTVKDHILKLINTEFKEEGRIMEDVDFTYTIFERNIDKWFTSEYETTNPMREFATVISYTTRDASTERSQLELGGRIDYGSGSDSSIDTKILDLDITFKTMYDRSMRKSVTEFTSGDAKVYFDYGLDNMYRPEGRITLGVHLQDAVDKFIYNALISSGISDIDEFDVGYTMTPNTMLNLVCEHILVAIRESKSDIETTSASFRIVVTRKAETDHA